MSESNDAPQVLTPAEREKIAQEGAGAGFPVEMAREVVAEGEEMLEAMAEAKVEAGETPEQAVAEVRKETGLGGAI